MGPVIRLIIRQGNKSKFQNGHFFLMKTHCIEATIPLIKTVSNNELSFSGKKVQPAFTETRQHLTKARNKWQSSKVNEILSKEIYSDLRAIIYLLNALYRFIIKKITKIIDCRKPR